MLDVLRLGAPRAYQLNRDAWASLAGHGLPAAVVTALGRLPHGVDLDADSFGALLDAHVPRLGPQQRAHILDAAAIGAYRAQRAVPVVEILVCDDAPQFKGVTAEVALCWVHAGRHFKKLAPIFAHHRAKRGVSFLKCRPAWTQHNATSAVTPLNWGASSQTRISTTGTSCCTR